MNTVFVLALLTCGSGTEEVTPNPAWPCCQHRVELRCHHPKVELFCRPRAKAFCCRPITPVRTAVRGAAVVVYRTAVRTRDARVRLHNRVYH